MGPVAASDFTKEMAEPKLPEESHKLRPSPCLYGPHAQVKPFFDKN